MGAWKFVDPYLEGALAQSWTVGQASPLCWAPASASTATGQMSKHLARLRALLDQALAA